MVNLPPLNDYKIIDQSCSSRQNTQTINGAINTACISQNLSASSLPMAQTAKRINESDADKESKQTVHNATQTQPSPTGMNSVVKSNELLCFIFNKMQKIPTDYIISLCTEFYSAEAIATGKQLLFNDTEHIRDSKLRYVKRTGSDKKKNDIIDIMKVFNSIEVKCLPTYAASDLNNLPPLNAFDTDVVGIYRDVQELKKNMQLVLESRSDIATLVQNLSEFTKHGHKLAKTEETNVAKILQPEIREKRNEHTSSVHFKTSQSSLGSSVSTDHDSPLISPPTTLQLHASTPTPTLINARNPIPIPTNVPAPIPVQCNTSARTTPERLVNENDTTRGQDSSQGSYITVDYTSCSDQSVKSDSISQNESNGTIREGVTYAEVLQNSQIVHPWIPSRHSSPRNKPRRTANHVKGSIHNHRSDSIIYGQGETIEIKAMGKTHRDKVTKQYNRVATGVFVTRLHPRTSPKQLQKHLQQEVAIRTNPEKLQTKYDTYASFYIPCEEKVRVTIMDKNLWPKGSFVKLFYTN